MGNYFSTQTDPHLQYHIHEDIIWGQTNSSLICQAVNRESGLKCAVKIIVGENVSEPLLLSKFNHPHIIKMYYYYCFESRVYIFVELAEQNLFQFQINKNDELLRTIFKQMVDAVKECHRLNIIHCDIKLENFLVINEKIVLADFGLAVEQTNAKINNWAGTTVYCPPEVLKSVEHDGRPRDIWSLGICLYILYYGLIPYKCPIKEDIPFEIERGRIFFPANDDVSPDLKNLILSCLQLCPKNRLSIQEIEDHIWLK